MILGIKKMIIFEPYKALLAIATNIPVLLMTGFVLQGHMHFKIALLIMNESNLLCKHECRLYSPGCFWSWQHWGHQVPVFSHRYLEPCSNNTPPPHTSPDSDRAEPDYSAAWPRLGDPAPTPEQ